MLKHDAVRAVQTAVKYATKEQRRQIAKELKGTYAQLAESRYAKFLIGKLLSQDDEIRDMIIPEFYGKVHRLINHSEASWILDDVYRGVATKQQKAVLLREWYGPEFSLFALPDSQAETTADLAEILEKEPSKRSPIMKHLMGMVNALIQKQMTGFTMLHDAMLQHFLNLKPGTEDQKEFLEIVKADESGDLLKNLAFTKSGARLVCLLLAYGTAKDRKQLLKTYKDTFQLMCGDPNGHVVILAAYDVIDDTVFTAKTIFPELLGKTEQQVSATLSSAPTISTPGRQCCTFSRDPAKPCFQRVTRPTLRSSERYTKSARQLARRKNRPEGTNSSPLYLPSYLLRLPKCPATWFPPRLAAKWSPTFSSLPWVTRRRHWQQLREPPPETRMRSSPRMSTPRRSLTYPRPLTEAECSGR